MLSTSSTRNSVLCLNASNIIEAAKIVHSFVTDNMQMLIFIQIAIWYQLCKVAFRKSNSSLLDGANLLLTQYNSSKVRLAWQNEFTLLLIDVSRRNIYLSGSMLNYFNAHIHFICGINDPDSRLNRVRVWQIDEMYAVATVWKEAKPKAMNEIGCSHEIIWNTRKKCLHHMKCHWMSLTLQEMGGMKSLTLHGKRQKWFNAPPKIKKAQIKWAWTIWHAMHTGIRMMKASIMINIWWWKSFGMAV